MRPWILALVAAGCGAKPVQTATDAAPHDLTVVYDFSVGGHDGAVAADLAMPDLAGADASADMTAAADLEINYCVVQFPKMTTAKVNVPTELIYGQVYQKGLTDAEQGKAAAGILAQIGFGPQGSDPLAGQWIWQGAVPNPGYNWANNNDEYQAQLTIAQAGSYWYAYRFSVTNGAGWTYCDTVGNGGNNNLPAFDPAKSGQLTVN